MKASVASEKHQKELNLRFLTCCVTCETKKEVSWFPVVKNVNQIWRTWFSHSILPIPDDFAMNEDQKPTRDLERDRRFRDRLFERTAQWLFCWRRLLFFFFQHIYKRSSWRHWFYYTVHLCRWYTNLLCWGQSDRCRISHKFGPT